jgi:hypothetical protein
LRHDRANTVGDANVPDVRVHLRRREPQVGGGEEILVFQDGSHRHLDAAGRPPVVELPEESDVAEHRLIHDALGAHGQVRRRVDVHGVLHAARVDAHASQAAGCGLLADLRTGRECRADEPDRVQDEVVHAISGDRRSCARHHIVRADVVRDGIGGGVEPEPLALRGRVRRGEPRYPRLVLEPARVGEVIRAPKRRDLELRLGKGRVVLAEVQVLPRALEHERAHRQQPLAPAHRADGGVEGR